MARVLRVPPPSPEDAQIARAAFDAMSPDGPTFSVCITSGDGAREVLLPAEVYPLLREILRLLAEGRGVSVIGLRDEMSTQRAADLLEMSRPHLIKLLESGEIPFHRVGTHRRVKLADIQNFESRRGRNR